MFLAVTTWHSLMILPVLCGPEAHYDMFPGFELEGFTTNPNKNMTQAVEMDPECLTVTTSPRPWAVKLHDHRITQAPTHRPTRATDWTEWTFWTFWTSQNHHAGIVKKSVTVPETTPVPIPTEATVVINLRPKPAAADIHQINNNRISAASALRYYNMMNHNRSVESENSTCPVEARGMKVGSYQIPTRRELAALALRTLRNMYAIYQQKVYLFLGDVKKVLKDTEELVKNCPGNKARYRKCVKNISSKTNTIADSFSYTLELQRLDVIEFGRRNICTIEDMKVDPLNMIKILASEEASLIFALPGFLRLVNACYEYCSSNSTNKTPTRLLSEKDTTVRHFLTLKRYVRLLGPDAGKMDIKTLNKTENTEKDKKSRERDINSSQISLENDLK